MEQMNAIEVSHISKSFKVYFDKGHTIKEQVVSSKRRRYEKREVLKNISFSVTKGEAIGLIGHNGCGKSTTLKLLTKIMYPDSGSIVMRGRVSSLIELGAGFHPDMSGRENIYINASIFGLTKKEIDRRIDDIIAFSELEEFIDNPVRTYSSGMYMRLAFSVAINVDADILLIDEILAVGDVNFQAKCFNRMREIKAEGTTIVIVSHSLGQIEQICDRTIWIHEGKIKEEGRPHDVHLEYLKYMGDERQKAINKEKIRQEEKHIHEIEEKEKSQNSSENREESTVSDENRINQTLQGRWGIGTAEIKKIVILDANEKEKNVFATGENAVIRIFYDIKEPIYGIVFGFSFTRADGVYCYGTNTDLDGIHSLDSKKGGSVDIKIKRLNLLPGQYDMDFEIKDGKGQTLDYYRKACRIETYTEYGDVGIVRLEHNWQMHERQL